MSPVGASTLGIDTRYLLFGYCPGCHGCASFGHMHTVARPVRKAAGPAWVNDTHSALNHTTVSRVLEPRCLSDVVDAVTRAARLREPLAIGGARHAMGGQQFLSEGALLDMRRQF